MPLCCVLCCGRPGLSAKSKTRHLLPILPSLGLLPNDVHTRILVLLCPCVIPIAFFGERPWQPSFQRLFVVSERGNYEHFFEKGCPELV